MPRVRVTEYKTIDDTFNVSISITEGRKFYIVTKRYSEIQIARLAAIIELALEINVGYKLTNNSIEFNGFDIDLVDSYAIDLGLLLTKAVAGVDLSHLNDNNFMHIKNTDIVTCNNTSYIPDQHVSTVAAYYIPGYTNEYKFKRSNCAST
jgi:hypothetical protein